MTEVPPPQPPEPQPHQEAAQRHEPHDLPEPSLMPSWIPVLIGAVLVAMAGLAVYTGMRYRENNVISRIIHPRASHTTAARPSGNGPSGELSPGGSLVYSGDQDVPVANEPAPGRSRAEITGGGANGVLGTLRIAARRGMMLNVEPDDALVYVNELAVGQAKQFNTQDEIYDFPAPGSYTVRISAQGYKDRTFVVTAAENAKNEIARIDAKLDKE